MKNTVENLRNLAKKLLTEKQVDFIIGYGNGSDLYRTTPVFISQPEDVDKLTWSPFCINNLSKYLLDDRAYEGKIGIVVKGCDSRAINRLIQDKQVKRENIVVIGIPCSGQLDPKKLNSSLDTNSAYIEASNNGEAYVVKSDSGEATFAKKDTLWDKCLTCESPNPVVADHVVGDKVDAKAPAQDYAEVLEIEKMTPEERNAYWEKMFSRCVRCYACRNVCPACSCTSCVFDDHAQVWYGKTTNSTENHNFHITRAMHVAGRCVDCGECDRVCPMDLPLRKINKKIQKDMKELFSMPTPGLEIEDESTLGRYAPQDPEEFM